MTKKPSQEKCRKERKAEEDERIFFFFFPRGRIAQKVPSDNMDIYKMAGFPFHAVFDNQNENKFRCFKNNCPKMYPDAFHCCC